MNILVPKTITAAMFAPGTTVAEVDADAGEVAWASGTDYALGQRRMWEGYTYECVKAVTGNPQNTVEPSATQSAGFWEKDENAPSARTAPFDKYLFTKARKAHALSYVLDIGFATGVAIYGLEADQLDISLTAGAGGADLIEPVHIGLWQAAFGEYEYLFGDLQRGTYFTLKSLPLHPAARLTITISRNDPLAQAAVGSISIGNWKQLAAPLREHTGAAKYGVDASTKDYSRIEEKPDGTYTEKPGRLATNISLTCEIDAARAPAAKALLDQVLGKVVAIEVSDLPRYSHLATVGKVTGSVRARDWAVAQVELQIKGNI